MTKLLQYINIIMTPADNSAVRYSLIKDGTNPLIIIGFNPSMANSNIPDRTMDSVLRLASFNGYDGFVMLNLYPLRSTNPKSLPLLMDDVLHRNNIGYIKEALNKYPNSDILLAYGNLMNIRPFTRNIAKEIIAMLQSHNRNILCIRRLVSGNPMHPLYANRNTKFISYF